MTTSPPYASRAQLRQISAAGDHFKSVEDRFLTRKNLEPGEWAVVRLDGHGFSRWVKRNFPTAKGNNWNEQFELAMSTAAKAMAEIYRPQLVYTFSDEVTLVFAPHQMPNLNGGRILKLCTLFASAMTAEFALSSQALRAGASDDMATFDARTFSLPDIESVALNVAWRMSDARRNSVAHWSRQYSSAKELCGMASAQLIGYTERKGEPGNRPTPWRMLPSERQCGRLYSLAQVAKVWSEADLEDVRRKLPKFDISNLQERVNDSTGEKEYVITRPAYVPANQVLQEFCGENPKTFFEVQDSTIAALSELLAVSSRSKEEQQQ
jgi:tRNA(His) 5'-end guanylyltransferase